VIKSNSKITGREKMTKSAFIPLKKSDVPSLCLPVFYDLYGADFFLTFHYTGFFTPFFQRPERC